MNAPIHALVMAGGFSRRMGLDKALLDYHGEAQALWTAKLLSNFCAKVFISCRAEQNPGTGADWPRIHDLQENQGPLGGFLSAHTAHPDAAWFAVACDLPLLSHATLLHLLQERDHRKMATVFRSAHDGLPEPLCAIYEPGIMPVFRSFLAKDRRCPRGILIQQGERVKQIDLPERQALDNFNTPEDLARLRTV